MSNPSAGLSAKELREDRVIEALRSSMALFRGVPVAITKRPDRDPNGHGGCDAVLKAASDELAVEVEILESFPGQYADDAAFRKYFVPLAPGIARSSPQSTIWIVVPVGALPKSTSWPQIAHLLKQGVISELSSMGREGVTQPQITGVPFRPTIMKRATPPGRPGCMLARADPGTELEKTISTALGHGNRQLVSYKREGKKTIVVLDSDDVALASPLGIVRSVAAVPLPGQAIDDVYVARTMPEDVFIYPARIGGRVLPDLPELLEYMRLREAPAAHQ